MSKIMQMCADEIVGYLKRIAELENQLEDLQRDNKELISVYESRITNQQEIMSYWEHKNEELKQQLAESEEENETFRKALQGEIFINYEIPMENERLKQQLAEKDQDKIDFAIAQIQKAWDMFSKEYFANEKMETLGTRFLASLDQQIKELKG